MKRRLIGIGFIVAVAWAATVFAAYQWGFRSVAGRLPKRAAETPARSDADRLRPTPTATSAAPAPEAFSPDDRPSWRFTPRFDAGRRRVLHSLLKDANDDDLQYAMRIFGGLDAVGREEALERLKTIGAVDLRKAAFQVLFGEWAAQEPEAAIRAAEALKDTPGGDAAVAHAWAQFLGDDPAAAAWAFDSWPIPDDWGGVMRAMNEASEGADDYRAYAAVLQALVEQDACDMSELVSLTMPLNGERWGTPSEALRLFSAIQAHRGDFRDIDETRGYFSAFISAYLDDPESVAALAALIPEIDHVTTRAAMIMGMGEAWLKNDPGAALASTDLLPPGLREKAHSELFEQLIKIDPAGAGDYFSQMPTGELRDHLIASSTDGWIDAWGRESLLAQVPGVQSDIVVIKMLDAAVKSLERQSWDYQAEPGATDPSIAPLLASQERMPAGRRRDDFVESVYRVWARSGTDTPAVIAARLNQETALTPDKRRQMMERLTDEYESGIEMREAVRKRREESEDDELISLQPFILDEG